jgi:integrase
MTHEAPAHLQPLRRRRGPLEIVSERPALTVIAGERPTIAQAVAAFLADPNVGWRAYTRRMVHYFLESGRFPAFCAAEGLVTIDDLTTDKLGEFLGQLRELGASREYQAKHRQHFRRFAEWCAHKPGYGIGGMVDIDRIEPITVPRQRFRKGLSWTKTEEKQVIRAAGHRDATDTVTWLGRRDRLIVECGLAWGLRPSELAGLLVDDVELHRRPPRVHIHGSSHDPELTKSSRGRDARDRMVSFRPPYNVGLPSRLLEWIEKDRDPNGRNPDRHVFLGATTREALTVSGLDQVYQRIERETGIRAFPYKARHTWATRLADATPPVPPAVLMMQGGWESMELVLRYYEGDVEEAARIIDAAHV